MNCIHSIACTEIRLANSKAVVKSALMSVALTVATITPPVSGDVLLSTGFPSTFNATLNQLPSPLMDADFIDGNERAVALFNLGQLLFFDPILSGNRNISCGTCHDPSTGTSDALALSIGEGGIGQGVDRRTDNAVLGRVPRNAQSLYNIGAREYRSFFHDGRLDYDSTHIHGAGFVKIDSVRLPNDVEKLLVKQAFFPVTSAVEMAGQPGENPIADAVARYQLAGEDGAWDLIADRLRELPDYISQFDEAFNEVSQAADLTYSHVARALAFFQAKAFRSTDSRFDKLLETRQARNWTEREQLGLTLFYGKAGCSRCHSGALQTDHSFHAIAMPQIGPGKGHGHDSSYQQSSGFADRLEDEGRYRVSRDVSDRFRFRTPSLRNVAITGPWGHAGAYESLEEVVRHHLNPTGSLDGYDGDRAERILAPLENVLDTSGRGFNRTYTPVDPVRLNAFNSRRGFVQDNEVLRSRISMHNDLESSVLSDEEVAALVVFLHTLTDPNSVDQSSLIPTHLPSGLEPQPAPLRSNQ